MLFFMFETMVLVFGCIRNDMTETGDLQKKGWQDVTNSALPSVNNLICERSADSLHL